MMSQIHFYSFLQGARLSARGGRDCDRVGAVREGKLILQEWYAEYLIGNCLDARMRLLYCPIFSSVKTWNPFPVKNKQ